MASSSRRLRNQFAILELEDEEVVHEGEEKEPEEEKGRIEVELRYQYSKKTGDGHVIMRNHKAPVWVSLKFGDPYEHSKRLIHDNITTCKFVDYEEKCMVRTRREMPILEYLEAARFLYTFKIPLPSDDLNLAEKKIAFLTSTARHVIKQIIHYVVDQHSAGYCLDRFTSGNLFVNANYGTKNVKFVDVGHTKYTWRGRENDFLCVRAVIGDMIDHFSADSVVPLLDLCERLKNACKVFKKDDIKTEAWALTHHLALLPAEGVLTFIRNASQEAEGLTKKLKNRGSIPICRALDNCNDSNWNNWNQIFDSPELGVLKENLENSHYTYTHRLGLRVKVSLLKCCRNFGVHLNEKKEFRFVNSEIKEAVIMEFMGKFLFELHHSLCGVIFKDLKKDANSADWYFT